VIRTFVNHTPGAKEISFTPTQLLPASNYRWWVQAIGADGRTTAWSRATDFNVPVPSIIAPRGLINTNLPNFVWRGVTEYVKYDLWVDNLTTGQKQVLRIQDLVGLSYQTTLPFENGNFRAWIRAFDSKNNISQWSGPADFSINVGVGNAPTLLAPSGFAVNRVNFLWTGGSRAVTYEILVKDMSQPSQPIVINQRGLQTTSFQAPINLVSGRNYRWWVRGLDAGGSGLPWSQPLDFRVVSSETPTEPAGDTPLLAAIDVNSLITTSLSAAFDDGFRSISVHSNGVVLQIDPTAAEAVPASVPQTADGSAVVIDALMAEYLAPGNTDGLLGFEELPTAAAIPAAAPALTSSEHAQRQTTATPVGILGMLAGLVLSRRMRRNDEEERSVQG
jgi:hypothetical protein